MTGRRWPVQSSSYAANRRGFRADRVRNADRSLRQLTRRRIEDKPNVTVSLDLTGSRIGSLEVDGTAGGE